MPILYITIILCLQDDKKTSFQNVLVFFSWFRQCTNQMLNGKGLTSIMNCYLRTILNCYRCNLTILELKSLTDWVWLNNKQTVSVIVYMYQHFFKRLFHPLDNSKTFYNTINSFENIFKTTLNQSVKCIKNNTL